MLCRQIKRKKNKFHNLTANYPKYTFISNPLTITIVIATISKKVKHFGNKNV